MRSQRIISYLALLIAYFLTQTLQTSLKTNNCKLKMALNRMAFLKADDQLIFNEGLLKSDVYGENATHPYTSPNENEIEYFYIFEDKIVNVHNHDKIKTFVISTDPSILSITSSVQTGNSEFKESFDLSEIEVNYSCIKGKSGRVKVSMSVTSDQCDPFTIYWFKQCNPEISSNLPHVNIGITPRGDDLYKQGQFLSQNVTGINSEFLIPSVNPTVTLYIFSPEKESILSEPEVILNEENLVAIFHGDLRKGGVLHDTPQSLTLAMACAALKKSKTDIQIKLKIENQALNLFFKKECDTTHELEEYFSIITFIYWLFLILIVFFLIAIFFYYLKKNDLTLFDLLEKTREFCRDKIYLRYFASPSNNTHKKELGIQRKEKLYEDDHLDESLDIKIKSKDSDEMMVNRKQEISKNTLDYGGI